VYRSDSVSTVTLKPPLTLDEGRCRLVPGIAAVRTAKVFRMVK
jgi:hypothetical protein